VESAGEILHESNYCAFAIWILYKKPLSIEQAWNVFLADRDEEMLPKAKNLPVNHELRMQTIQEMHQMGCTDDEIALSLGISKRSLSKWKSLYKHGRFREVDGRKNNGKHYAPVLIPLLRRGLKCKEIARITSIKEQAIHDWKNNNRDKWEV
jgi:transposase